MESHRFIIFISYSNCTGKPSPIQHLADVIGEFGVCEWLMYEGRNAFRYKFIHIFVQVVAGSEDDLGIMVQVFEPPEHVAAVQSAEMSTSIIFC